MSEYNIKITADGSKAKNEIGGIEKGLGGLTASAGKFKAALGVAGAAFAAFGAAQSLQNRIDEMDNLAKAARTAGAAASEDAFKGFQVMKQALAEAGVDAGTADRAFLNISQRMKEGAEGGKSFAGVFETMKSEITGANGELKSSPEILQAMINALNEGKISTDEFQKVVGGRAGPVINELFGKMQGNAEGLAATLADVEANTNIVSLDASESAEKFNDTMGRLGEQMGKVGTMIVEKLLPHLVPLAEELLANMPTIIEKVTSAFSALQPVFGLIGTVLTEVVFPVMQSVFEVLGFIAEAIAPLVETAIPSLKVAFESIVEIVEKVVGFFQGVAEGLQNIYNKAIALKDGVTGGISSMGDSIVDATTEMTDGMKKKWNDFYMWAYGGSLVPDLVDGIISEMMRMKEGATQATGEATAQMTNDFQNLSDTIEQDFVGTLESALSDGKLTLSDFEGFFKKTLTNLITDAMNGGNQLSNIFGSIFGGGGGGGFLGGLFGGGGGGLGGFFSSAISGIGSFFGGLFANGGYLPAGKFGIAGEAGAEIITGPARVYSNEDSFGGGTNVTFNIHAIDTQTGTQFLLDNKQQIVGMVQQAGHRRGKEIF